MLLTGGLKNTPFVNTALHHWVKGVFFLLFILLGETFIDGWRVWKNWLVVLKGSSFSIRSKSEWRFEVGEK